MTRFAAYTLSVIFITAGLTATSAGQNLRKTFGVIEQALAAVGDGPAETMKNRLFTYQITVVDADDRRRAIEALPVALRSQRITQGKLFRRVESGLRQVLQLHNRLDHGQVELFLFHDDIPTAQL